MKKEEILAKLAAGEISANRAWKLLDEADKLLGDEDEADWNDEEDEEFEPKGGYSLDSNRLSLCVCLGGIISVWIALSDDMSWLAKLAVVAAVMFVAALFGLVDSGPSVDCHPDYRDPGDFDGGE